MLHYDIREVPLGDYLAEKIRMLEEDFGFRLSYTEIESINSCTSALKADRVAHDIIKHHL